MKPKIIKARQIMHFEGVSYSTAWRRLQLTRDCLGKKAIRGTPQPVTIEEYCALWDINPDTFKNG
jgi:predicted DNA-binding transcriptional regulator AlpA